MECVALGMGLGNGRVRWIGEGSVFEAERLDDLLAVQFADGLSRYLLEDEPEQNVVGVGVEPLGTGIELRRILDTSLCQLFGLPDPVWVGGPFFHPLIVRRVAGDPAGHIGHLPECDLIPVGYALDAGLIRQARLVLGGVALVPWRSLSAEAVLEGQRPSPELAFHAAAAALANAAGVASKGGAEWAARRPRSCRCRFGRYRANPCLRREEGGLEPESASV